MKNSNSVVLNITGGLSRKKGSMFIYGSNITIPTPIKNDTNNACNLNLSVNSSSILSLVIVNNNKDENNKLSAIILRKSLSIGNIFNFVNTTNKIKSTRIPHAIFLQ
jgi:hypothetical protein